MNRLRLAAIAIVSILVLAPAAHAQKSGIEGLHDALGLNAAQEVGWKTFVSATTSNGQREARQERAAKMMPTLTAPQRADLSIAMMRADLETLEGRAAALRRFYAMLSPAQQGVFDRQTAPQQQAQQ